MRCDWVSISINDPIIRKWTVSWVFVEAFSSKSFSQQSSQTVVDTSKRLNKRITDAIKFHQPKCFYSSLSYRTVSVTETQFSHKRSNQRTGSCSWNFAANSFVFVIVGTNTYWIPIVCCHFESISRVPPPENPIDRNGFWI